jgi:hypothetical protein
MSRINAIACVTSPALDRTGDSVSLTLTRVPSRRRRVIAPDHVRPAATLAAMSSISASARCSPISIAK